MIITSTLTFFGTGLLAGGLLYQQLLRKRLSGVHQDCEQQKQETLRDSLAVSEKAREQRELQQTTLAQRVEDEKGHLQAQHARAKKSAHRRSERLEQRRQANDLLRARIDQIDESIRAKEEELGQTRQSMDEATRQQSRLTEERAGSTGLELKGELISELVGAKKIWLARQARHHSELLQQNADVRARLLIKGTTERYSGAGHLERLQNQIEVPNARAFAALSDPEHPAHQMLIEQIGFELRTIAEKKNTLLVQGDNPLAREVARRVIRQLANRSITAPNKVRAISSRTREEVEREVQNAGRKATRIFGMKNVHPEVLELVGRLKFRLSYSQNQLKHAIEVAYLSGLMAEELGLNIAHAQRGGLLHDIGKALTHEREGSHAVLGAEVARRCGEDEVIANAIGSHHHDEPMETPIATIVTAADALSGARPGARRETATLFLERVQQIEEIARRDSGVERVEIMHGGREVRVIVGGQQLGHDAAEQKGKSPIGDEALHPLAEDIAQDIEDEVIYPGQVRVTVIRESRATSIAH